MESRCPRCGVELVRSGKDTSSGEEVYSLDCPACGHSEVGRGGQALWSVLSDDREWHEALEKLSGKLVEELPGRTRKQLEEGLRQGSAESVAAVGRIAERRAEFRVLGYAGDLLRQISGEAAARELDRLGLLLAREFFAAIGDPAPARTRGEELWQLPSPCCDLCFRAVAREALLAAAARGQLHGFIAQFVAATSRTSAFTDPQLRRSFGDVLAVLAETQGGRFADALRGYPGR